VVLRNTLHGTYDITAFVSEFITLRCTELEVSVPELSLCVISVKYGFDIQRTVQHRDISL